MIAAIYARTSTAQNIADEEIPLMVPVEVTAFGLLAVCVILFVNLIFPQDAARLARFLLVPAPVMVVVLAIYVLMTRARAKCRKGEGEETMVVRRIKDHGKWLSVPHRRFTAPIVMALMEDG